MSDNATMSEDTTTEQIKELVVIDTTDTDFAPSPTKKSTPRFIKILYGVLGVIVALICVLFSAAWAYSQCISPVICEVGSTPDYSALENNIILSAFAKADCEIDKIDCSKVGKTSVPIKFLGKFSLYSPLEFVDTTPPTTKGFEITVSQNLSLSAEMFLPMFFDHSEISVEIIKNDYVLNSVGEYNITFKVTDEYGNSSQFD
ncbi:MAG: hypothetical protein IKU45_06455, partial [Clostridia bacterium]|nr:hypothetical protein [Clostridia bacterium]